MMRLRTNLLAFFIVCLFMALSFSPTYAASVIYQASNASVIFGQPYSALEFENPLPAGATVLGRTILEWRDADYLPGPWYDDWIAHNTGVPGQIIDGSPTEIWMHHSPQFLQTITTVTGSIVSVHLVGRNKDGLARITIDNIVVADLDMGTIGPQQTVLVLVSNLSNTTHDIRVYQQGMGPRSRLKFPDLVNYDTSVLGAAVLAPNKVFRHFWYRNSVMKIYPTPPVIWPIYVPHGYYGGWWWWHHQCSWYRPWYGPIGFPGPGIIGTNPSPVLVAFWRANGWWPPRWYGGPYFWGFKKCLHYGWFPTIPYYTPNIAWNSWFWDPAGQGHCLEVLTKCGENDPFGENLLPVDDEIMANFVIEAHQFSVNGGAVEGDFNDIIYVQTGNLVDYYAGLPGVTEADVNAFEQSDVVQKLLLNDPSGEGYVGVQYAQWEHPDSMIQATSEAAGIIEGNSFTYGVSLLSPPVGDVNVAVIPSGTDLAVGDPCSGGYMRAPGESFELFFEPGNWDVNQPVTVMAVDDADSEGEEIAWVAHAYSEDPNSGFVFEVAIHDNECGGLGYVMGDLDYNCEVDFVDFAVFAEDWLKSTEPMAP